MGLTAALGEAGFAEGSASGELSDPDEDLIYIGVFGIKRATMPAREYTMLPVLWIGDGVDEQFEAGNAANVFRRCTACAVDVARIFDSGIGVGFAARSGIINSTCYFPCPF